MGRKENWIAEFDNIIGTIDYQALTPQKEWKLSDVNTDNPEVFINEMLQFFPEISANNIEIFQKSIQTSMACQPKLIHLFNKKRTYQIVINNDPDSNEIPFSEIPFQAKVGIIAHELSHVLDYQSKNFWQLIQTGILYIFRRQEKYEKFIDYLTIKKGFGWQVLAWSDYVFNHSNASEAYLAYKDKYYYNPKEIESILAADEKYNKLKNLKKS